MNDRLPSMIASHRRVGAGRCGLDRFWFTARECPADGGDRRGIRRPALVGTSHLIPLRHRRFYRAVDPRLASSPATRVASSVMTRAGMPRMIPSHVTVRHKYGTMDQMRTTVDIPDGMYRQLKSRAAREGSSTRALILRGVRELLKSKRRKAGVPVSLPIVRSKRPGAVTLDNAKIYDIAFP